MMTGGTWTSREAADDFLDRYVSPTHMDVAVGAVLILLVLEATRRATGWIMPVLSMTFFAYGLWGNYLPAPWTHKGYPIVDLIAELYMTLNGIFGSAIDVSATLIILFTIFGAILQASGRLAQAKVVIYELLEALPNERIGFIGFAGTPYVYAPLTIDHSAVREITEQVDDSWAPLGGSDLPAAVHLATETLKKTGQKNNALIILSDGEEVHDDERGGELKRCQIAEAERSGVYVIAIGVGTEDGGFVPNPDFPNGQMVDRSGRTVISRLQADTLRKLGLKGPAAATVPPVRGWIFRRW